MRASPLARGGEQHPPGVGQAARLGAHPQHVGQLHAVEAVELGQRLGAELGPQQGVVVADLALGPGGSEAPDLRLDLLAGDLRARGQRRHALERRREVAEVAGPARRRRGGEAEELQARGPAEGHASAVALGVALELVVEVRLDVLRALAQRRHAEGPDVDAGQQVVAEAARAHAGPQVAVGPGDQLKVAADLAVAADREEHAVLERAQQHRLLVEAELADLVEEEHAAVGALEHAGSLAHRPGEGAAGVAEHGRHRRVAAQGGAVELDEAAGDLVSGLLELEDLAGQAGLAGAGRTGQQDR